MSLVCKGRATATISLATPPRCTASPAHPHRGARGPPAPLPDYRIEKKEKDFKKVHRKFNQRIPFSSWSEAHPSLLPPSSRARLSPPCQPFSPWKKSLCRTLEGETPRRSSKTSAVSFQFPADFETSRKTNKLTFPTINRTFTAPTAIKYQQSHNVLGKSQNISVSS